MEGCVEEDPIHFLMPAIGSRGQKELCCDIYQVDTSQQDHQELFAQGDLRWVSFPATIANVATIMGY